MCNKEIVKYFYEVIVSQHKLEELPAYLAEDCVRVSGSQRTPIGIEGMRQHLISIRKTYPDYSVNIIRQYEDGNTVISEIIMRGTHGGEFIGITPTNKIIEITGVDIDKVFNGKIVEHGGAMNTFDAFVDAGLIKPI